MKLVDLSTEFRAGMPKPPSAPVVEMHYAIKQSREQEEERGYSNKLEEFRITTHVGTHFDAPSHFTTGGRNIDELPLEMFYQVPTLVLDVEQEEYGCVTLEDIRRAEEKAGEVQKGDFVILNTGFYRWYEDERYLHTAYVSVEAAAYLAEREISILGIDCFTVDDSRDKKKPVHVLLLKEKEIPIVECIVNLDKIPAPRFFSVCFPLKVKDGSGGFTRLVGIFEDKEEEK